MNKAESSGISDQLDSLGFQRVKNFKEADLMILNTCVVRQSAEDKVRGMLGYLKGIKAERPDMRIAVTGCFVGDELKELSHKFPQVDFFCKPGQIEPLRDWLSADSLTQSGQIGRPSAGATPVSAYIPIIQGCDNFCSYCIVPFRRGREISRQPAGIVEQAENLVEQGAREIVLLGQNVNAYGKDLADGTDLAGLLAVLNPINGLSRIRFLTNHPMDMSAGLMHSIGTLDKVCHHICLPLQSGDNRTLKAMNRHYTYNHYRSIIDHLRKEVPDIAVSTDIIVGFPGETEEGFMNTFRAIEETCFASVHVAAYSVRPGTSAAEKYEDNVLYETKMQRMHKIEALQRGILEKANGQLVGGIVEVLVEDMKGGKWYGRTYSDKPLFFEAKGDFAGKLVRVEVISSTPWSLQGKLVH